MGVGIVHRQEEGLLCLSDEFGGKGGVALHPLALEVGRGDLGEVEGKRLGRVDVQLADDSGAVADLLQAAHDVGRVAAVQAEFPRSQSDLAVLVGVQPGQKGGARLTAASLRHVGVLEANAAIR